MFVALGTQLEMRMRHIVICGLPGSTGVLTSPLPDPTEKKKTIESSPFFVRRGGHYCRGDLVGRTAF